MWILESKVKTIIEQAEAQGVMPSAEQQAEYVARHAVEAAAGESRIMVVAGDKAEISITGILTKSPSWLAMIFGGGNTTYSEIVSALAVAEQDDSISDITLSIDSPGGHFDGLFDALGAIAAAKKPVHAKVSGLAASAAFAIAAQADDIEALNKAARIGSVGVAATFGVSDNEVTITSTEAPKKRPDVTTEEGRADVRAELDALHSLFAESIANGRGTTVATVNKDFGRGATLLAEDALKRGMIDSIANSLPASPKAAPKTQTAAPTPKIQIKEKLEVKTMDLETLKREHPALFAQVVELGVSQERDRVGAHLTYGGNSDAAIAAVKDGSPMTQTLQAEYLMAAANSASVETRELENPELEIAPGADTPDKLGDKVATLVEHAVGMEGGTV